MCFGAIDDQFGRFQIEVDDLIEAFKLVHLNWLVLGLK